MEHTPRSECSSLLVLVRVRVRAEAARRHTLLLSLTGNPISGSNYVLASTRAVGATCKRCWRDQASPTALRSWLRACSPTPCCSAAGVYRKARPGRRHSDHMALPGTGSALVSPVTHALPTRSTISDVAHEALRHPSQAFVAVEVTRADTVRHALRANRAATFPGPPTMRPAHVRSACRRRLRATLTASLPSCSRPLPLPASRSAPWSPARASRA